MVSLIHDILICWLHGFGYKNGAEPWLLAKFKKERMNLLVKELKKND